MNSTPFIIEPTLYLDPDSLKTAPSYALIILNQCSEDNPPSTFNMLWKNAEVKVCSDGGANVLLRWIKRLGQSFIPDHIHGDLDSLSQESRDYFSSHNCSITRDPSDSSTDFTKATSLISSRYPKVATIWVMGELSGRFDHTIGMIQTLYLFPDTKIYIITHHCITFLLPIGQTKILLKRLLVGRHIGLLPIGNPVKQITTEGLCWNISKGQTLQFGGLISTSNTFSEESTQSTIVIDADEQLVFTIDLPFCAQ